MYHIECNKNEEWVGNVETKRDLSYLQSIKYRLGNTAYDIDGEKIDKDYMRPLFVEKESMDKYDRIMMARMKAK